MTQQIQLISDIRNNIRKVIVGKDTAVDLLLISLICSGHVLIEDIPGVGKTTLVSALAASLGCSFHRIQFTPDVLPSDITGFNMFNIKTGEKELYPGGVMNQIVLADEINRASPKTQSALLEVMQENQVTIDGVTYPSPAPFMVLATQNPIEMSGTYRLPEAQLDRFLMCVSMGYPSEDEERAILDNHRRGRVSERLSSVASADDVLALQSSLDKIVCSPAVTDYIVQLIKATRSFDGVRVGASPRGSIALMQAAKGCALLCGRDYVLPDDVQSMAHPVLGHRLILRSRNNVDSTPTHGIIHSVLKSVNVPAAK